jgi:hypothetical protein
VRRREEDTEELGRTGHWNCDTVLLTGRGASIRMLTLLRSSAPEPIGPRPVLPLFSFSCAASMLAFP